MRFDLGHGLEAARQAALAEVDRQARDLAAALGGDTPAHAAKREEAERFFKDRADRAPIDADYPMLAAEVGITAGTLLLVALLVEERGRNWKFHLGQIEAARLGAKSAIRSADSHAAIRAIVTAFKEDRPPP